MTKHILVHPDGSEEIVDLDKGVTLQALSDSLAGPQGAGFRLRSTSDLSPAFTLPAPVLTIPVFQVIITDGVIYFDTGPWAGFFGAEVIRDGVSQGIVYETISGVPLHTDLIDFNDVEQLGVLIGELELSLVDDADSSGTPTEQDMLVVSRVVALSKTAPTVTYRFFVGNTFHSIVEPDVPFSVPAGAAEQGVHVEVTVENGAGTSAAVESTYLPIEMTPEPEGITVTPVATLQIANATLSGNTYTWTLSNIPAGTIYASVRVGGDTPRTISGVAVKGQPALPVQANGRTASANSANITNAQVRSVVNVDAGAGTVSLTVSSTASIYSTSTVQITCVTGNHNVLDVMASAEANQVAPYNVTKTLPTAAGGALIGVFDNITITPNVFAGIDRIGTTKAFYRIPTSAADPNSFTVGHDGQGDETLRLVIAAISIGAA